MSQVQRIAGNGAAKPQNFSGTLHSELHLVLQTRHAQLLVRGRMVEDKPLIAGLLAFADRLRLIWQAAAEDDPFADWFLVRTHEAMSVAEARMDTEMKQLNLQLRSTRTFHIAPAEVKEPFRMALRFSTPYAYRAARMLGQFDELACHAFTAKRIGVINAEQCHDVVRACARRIRGVFGLPQRFRRLGITRDSAHDAQPMFQRAEELMGVLPNDVLTGVRRAPLAPPINGAEIQQIPPATHENTNDSVVFE
ncbi:MAG: TIGR03761 family integrating conjugative element protein [Gammaproteobacteria bacterium]|nr:TIGR03761 family integrating conjugative element protein [Gammaproteobacteria bacterium]